MYANLAARPQFNPASGENANGAFQGMLADGVAAAKTLALESRDLLRGHKAVEIMHNGAVYRLHNTKQGKLILTK
ncbi:MAG: hemin uptake protein HemP [Burkholderiales bacterium]|jgi:hemin uptake protein HemP|nr:hemin uptake protein HemP [Burkholderiales bacterium]